MNSKKLNRRMMLKVPGMANIVSNENFKHWKVYSREMAASIITTWSLKMIYKMRDKKENLPSFIETQPSIKQFESEDQ